MYMLPYATSYCSFPQPFSVASSVHTVYMNMYFLYMYIESFYNRLDTCIVTVSINELPITTFSLILALGSCVTLVWNKNYSQGSFEKLNIRCGRNSYQPHHRHCTELVLGRAICDIHSIDGGGGITV